MSDAPIEPQEYLYGVKVVQIEDLRVARGMTRRPASSCRHKKLVYDDKERRVWCSDCEAEVEPFDAFIGFVERFSAAESSITRRRRELDEAEKFQIRSRAAKVMDEAWRSTKMARRSALTAIPPFCPRTLPEVWQAHRKLWLLRRANASRRQSPNLSSTYQPAGERISIDRCTPAENPREPPRRLMATLHKRPLRRGMPTKSQASPGKLRW